MTESTKPMTMPITRREDIVLATEIVNLVFQQLDEKNYRAQIDIEDFANRVNTSTLDEPYRNFKLVTFAAFANAGKIVTVYAEKLSDGEPIEILCNEPFKVGRNVIRTRPNGVQAEKELMMMTVSVHSTTVTFEVEILEADIKVRHMDMKFHVNYRGDVLYQSML